jgi:PPP family 3-phenylpropionic acid transporter
MQRSPSSWRLDPLAWRLSGLYAAVFLVAGAKVPFLPVWLDWRGLTVAEISIIAAAPLFARIVVTPAIAFVADRRGDHRFVVVLLSWAALCGLLLLSQAHGFWMLLVLTLVIAMAWTSIMPLAETVTMSAVRSKGLDYGRMRLWGSLSFIAASIVGGMAVGWLGPASAVWLMVAGGALTVTAAHGLPRPTALAPADQSGRRAPAWSAIRPLVTSRSFLLFLLAVGCVQAAHAVFYTFGTVHWRAQGLSATWSGVLWAIGVIAEIVLFAFSGAAVRATGVAVLIMVGALAGVIRWTAMGFDPPLIVLVVLQVLHGATYGAPHLGAVHFISSTVPQELGGTAQALYASATAGIAMGSATLLAGWFYAAWGGGAYLPMAALALMGLLASLALLRRGVQRSEISC